MKKHEKLRHALDMRARFLADAAAAYCKEHMTALTLEAARGDDIAAYLIRADRDCTAAFRVLIRAHTPGGNTEHTRLWYWWNISVYIECDAANEYMATHRAALLAATAGTTTISKMLGERVNYLAMLGAYWEALPRKERRHWDKDLMTPETMMVPWKGSR